MGLQEKALKIGAGESLHLVRASKEVARKLFVHGVYKKILIRAYNKSKDLKQEPNLE